MQSILPSGRYMAAKEYPTLREMKLNVFYAPYNDLVSSANEAHEQSIFLLIELTFIKQWSSFREFLFDVAYVSTFIDIISLCHWFNN